MRLPKLLITLLLLPMLCLASGPDKSDVYFMEAMRRAALGDTDGYWMLLDKAYLMNPSAASVEAREISFRLMSIAETERDSAAYEQAYGMAKDYVKAKPDDSYAAVTLARIHHRKGRINEALKLLSHADSLNPAASQLSVYYAQLLTDAERYGDAVNVLQRIRRQMGSDPDLTFRISWMMLHQLSDTTAADDEVNIMVHENPTDPEALTIASSYFNYTGRPQTGDSLMLAALHAHPGDLSLLLHFFQNQTERDSIAGFERAAHYLVNAGLDTHETQSILPLIITQYNKDYEHQLNDLCRQLVTANTDNDVAQFFMAQYANRNGNPQEGETILRTMLEKDSSNIFALTDLIRSLAIQHREKEAISTGLDALKGLKDSEGEDVDELRHLLSLLLIRDDNYPKALELMQTVVDGYLEGRGDPKAYAEAWCTIGDLRQEVDGSGDPAQAYDQAVSLDPDNALQLNNYAYYLAQNDKDLDKALNMAQQAVKLNPDNAVYLDTLAWVLYKQGQYKAAQATINEAIEMLEEGIDPAEFLLHKQAIDKALK